MTQPPGETGRPAENDPLRKNFRKHETMKKIKAFLSNRWVGFTLVAVLYTLWFVVWTGNLWMLLGLPVIFDLYISRLFYRYVWHRNAELCKRSKTYKTVY